MPSQTGIESLSVQQRRCLAAVARGLSSAQIAHELGIAEGTVNAHIAAAMRKLGTLNRRQAAYILTSQAPRHDAALGGATSEELPNENLRVAELPFPAPPIAPGHLEEERAPFDYRPRQQEDRGVQPVSPIILAVRIAVITLAFAVVLLALKPLAEAAGDLARSINPPTAS